MPGNVLLLFNYTDYAAEPWLEIGCRVLSVDIQHRSRKLPRFVTEGEHVKVNWDIWGIRRYVLNTPWLNPDFIISMAPCTDLAASGAKHWARKERERPGFQREAATLAMFHAELWADVPSVLENPVGALTRLWRPPDLYCHPYEYGGWLPEDDVHPDYPQYILPRDAYPKKTGLWLHGGAQAPVKRPVPVAPGWSIQQKKLGGKSLKTKNIRSATPRGLFRAIFDANRHHVDPVYARERLKAIEIVAGMN